MDYNELLKKILNVTPSKIMFAACKGLKYLTRNEESFGNYLASAVCTVASFMLLRDAKFLFRRAYIAGKASAKAINKAAEYGEKCFGDHCHDGGGI